MDITPEQKEAIEAELREKMKEELTSEIEAEVTNRIKSQVASDNADLLESMVDEKLAKMKANLDNAYAKLEESQKLNIRLEDEKKAFERKRLEDEGKHLELAQSETVELRERNAILEEKITALTRDQSVKDVIAGAPFRNDVAREMAFDRIVSKLVNDENRGWVHESGASIEEFFKQFQKSSDNEFMFKPKENTGTGSSPGKSVKGALNKPMSEMTTTELLQAASEGQFGEFSYD